MKRIAVGVWVYLVALLMLMIRTSTVMAQTGGPEFTTQSNKQNALHVSKLKGTSTIEAQKDRTR